MWIFTNQSFISAVEHRDDPNQLMIRARRKEHLQALFAGVEITETQVADYRYRVTVRRAYFEEVMVEQVRAITYDNFKNSIADDDYHHACSQVWGVMHQMQPRNSQGKWSINRVALSAGTDAESWRCDACGSECCTLQVIGDEEATAICKGCGATSSPIKKAVPRCWECDIELPADGTDVLCPDCTMPDDQAASG